VLGGRTSTSATIGPSVQRIPLPAECEATWKELKVSIEGATHAKVSVARLTRAAEQYPNLIGFIEISGTDTIDPAELQVYLDTATARCYASASAAVPLENQQLNRLIKLTLTEIARNGNPPVYVTIDQDRLVLRYNQPL
jgi:hypothetical protein